MLTGRESLVRLIGRRRRSPLPASLALLLSPPSLSPSTSHQADDGGAGDAARVVVGGSSPGGSAGAGAEWVACPVCGESILGTDYCVNAHLDVCLTRGMKRKLTQSTLLDFRFSKKKTTSEPALDSLNSNGEAENMDLIDGDVSSDRAFFSRIVTLGVQRVLLPLYRLVACMAHLKFPRHVIPVYI